MAGPIILDRLPIVLKFATIEALLRTACPNAKQPRRPALRRLPQANPRRAVVASGRNIPCARIVAVVRCPGRLASSRAQAARQRRAAAKRAARQSGALSG